MFNQNILYSLVVLVVLLIGLLVRTYFVGGSRMGQITKATDLVRNGLERAQKELAVTQAEVKDLRAGAHQLEAQLRQRTEALLEQNLVMTQGKTELEQLRIGVEDLRDRLEKLEGSNRAQGLSLPDTGRPWRPGADERRESRSPEPIEQSETARRTASALVQKESSPGWQADLNEILKSLDSASARRAK
jgi:predicted nuclease with TOPRIM domain